MTDKKVLYIIF